ASAAWQTHTTQLDSDQSYALSLRNAAVTLDGIRYEGNFTIETEAPVFLQGAGDGAAALFAASATLGASDGRLIAGPSAGVASAGGTAVDVSNGLAIAGFDQSLTISEAGGSRDQIA